MVVLPVLRSHLLEEIDCTLSVVLGVMAVPVNDHVQIIGNGGVHHRAYFAQVAGRVFQVAAVFIHTHGGADQRGVPVLGNGLHSPGGVVLLATPTIVAPEQAGPGNAAR